MLLFKTSCLYYLLFFFAILFSSCEVKINTGKKENEHQKKPVRNKNKIRNGIKIQTTGGLRVEQAFLTYEDDGSFLDEENVTTINKPVKLNLVIKGWKEKDGKVFMDAEQKITTDDDKTLLHMKNMLAKEESFNPEYAEFLNFRFNVTHLNKIYNYFVVEARAWNKKFDQEVNASFKIHVE